ncbi:carboxynorspermidine decarboxylase [Deinococcus peraridilitoris]|uniref:Carboxynorspermidine decarboxylase n=1 Tax=Deinococcus peraridilitoris (strain DSM 19664 / LMG 22246 / CIP 109416 / KR-200) TaxID=937777 RepID=L0A7J6_DEIPD|nr:carboxynorspermidine decarboxylase [Deinococcus peraridilitoris]AFZ69030.1 carboxynorspermidine decarboxylase [Deinococcus peraridilitoris DSM 19664]
MTLTLSPVRPVQDISWDQIPSPAFVLDEGRLKRNLELIQHVADQSGAEIIVAFKGFAMWSSFDLVRQYVSGATASSLNEALLAKEEMRGEVHVYAPAYSDEDFGPMLQLADHLTFNSFSQWERFRPQVQAARAAGKKVGIGIRINPEYSEVGTALYNPSMPFSRLGVTRARFHPDLLDGVDGLHFHTLCENDSDTLERVLEVIEQNFGEFLPQMQWVNFGGGHLMTREGYDLERLIRVVRNFREKWGVKVILEPGSAFGWQTGWLVSSVLDVLHNEKEIAILDISVSAHMPDVLEMPYRPGILGAALPGEKAHTYLLGGTTCLSGDVVGEYSFDAPLQLGDRVVFDDMIHYTMVKTTFFNGVKHPDIGILSVDGQYRVVKQFGYEEFKAKLS